MIETFTAFGVFWFALLAFTLFSTDEISVYAQGAIYLASIGIWKLFLEANKLLLKDQNVLELQIYSLVSLIMIFLGIILCVQIIAHIIL